MVNKGPGDDHPSEDNDPSSAMYTAMNSNFDNAPPVNGGLAKLFRDLCAELDLAAFGWSQLMQQYLNNPANGIKNTPKARATARGNLNKELFRGRLTWKVFMKAIRFFNPVKAEFSVRLQMQDGRKVQATVSLMDRQPKKRERAAVNPLVISEDQRGLDKPDFPMLRAEEPIGKRPPAISQPPQPPRTTP